MNPHLLLACVGGFAVAASPAWADEPVVPGDGFAPSRYETLWTKSPFAVASAQTAAAPSPDYSLTGVARIGGVSYASLVDTHTNERFLLSSNKPAGGLTLTSITLAHDGSLAVVQKNDGQSITLKLETPPPPAPADLSSLPPNRRNRMTTMSNAPPASPAPGFVQPPVRDRPPTIRVPPPPGQ